MIKLNSYGTHRPHRGHSSTKAAGASRAHPALKLATSAAAVILSLSPSSFASEECRPQDAHFHPQLVEEVAALFGSGLGEDEKDPISAFTIYGTTIKKFLIEQLDGEKVVRRQRGFTVSTCATVVPSSVETPSFQFLPTRDKVQAAAGSGLQCNKSEGSELPATCMDSCTKTCTAVLDEYSATIVATTGYRLDQGDAKRLLRSCQRNCSVECTKPGKAFDFVIPFRK